MLKNQTLINALTHKPVTHHPVWIMRQAGRYLPEYREIRKKVSGFMELCRTTELATEVTLQPLRRFDLDAAILFSDILTIPAAMGLDLHFIEGIGPKFANPLNDEDAIRQLPLPDIEKDLRYVTDAVSSIKKALNGSVPLIGFAGSPWTLATYMVEGGPSKQFSKIKGMLYSKPDTLKLLLEKLAFSVREYLNAQIEAGANVVMIFDSWGGILTPDAYRKFSLHYMQEIITDLKRDNNEGVVPNIIFSKGAEFCLPAMAESGADCIGLDWTIDIEYAKRQVGDKIALQGNLDPCVLFGSADTIRHEARKILKVFEDDNGKAKTGHVFNLGHGIYPNVDPEKLNVLIDTVKTS